MIKLIIFDWDDVFSQGSTEGYYACYHHALLDVGIRLDPAEEDRRIKLQWGKGHREEIIELLREHPELVDQACETYEKHFFGNTFVDALHVTPGSQDLVRRLAKQYTLAIASGAHPVILKERVFPKFQMPNVFSQIITAYDLDDPEKSKPHPYIANTIMETQGTKPAETIMVGDAKNDVLMARAAGIEPVVVLTGHLNRQEAEELGVSYILDDVTQLETALTKLSNG